MKKVLLVLLAAASIVFMGSEITGTGDYQGTEKCSVCHSAIYDKLSKTLHSKIHLVPSVATMKADLTKEIDMGTAYSNAKVGFRVDGDKYYVILKPVGGNPVEHEIVYTYGGGWKQRFLVKIEDSYYMPPVQWNLNGYQDNSTGTWVTYNPGNWWNADGSLKPLNNTFRKVSWDKNCAGCHVVPGTKENTVTLKVTGVDTAWVYKWANNNSHANIVVGCESCHGYPTAEMGKGHVKNPKDLSYDRQLEVCGQCHTRGFSKHDTYEYPYDEETGKTYPIGEDLMNYYNLKPGLWHDKVTSRQHHQQWVDYKLTKHYNPEYGITCVTCHDPHQNTNNHFQLKDDFRKLESGKGCLKCHTNKADESNGINLHSKHPQNASTCVGCHMPKTAGSGKGYDISGHSFKVISPSKTIQYKDLTTPAKGMPNSCALSCHRNGKGTFGTGSNFGITDATLGDWTEASDLALADSLNKYYQIMFPTDVAEKIDGRASSSQITSNYPNPFKGSTTILFDISGRGNVKMEVYDIRGNLVNILANEYMDKGSYSLNWDGTSVQGFHMPSGVYYCYLTVNGQRAGTRSLVVSK